ncbi:hypothetical protein DITRI_Ditri01bG0010900 [Diplodiscus trichospermus]
MALKVSAQKAAEIAIASIGRGYDLSNDLRLKYCKGDANHLPLIEFGDVGYYDVALPGGVNIPNVSKLIKCNKGESMRNWSDAISFQQMSGRFNREMSLHGIIPSGYFNTMFDFSGCCQKDALNTRTLAFDGIFITLYTVSMEMSQIVLHEHVKKVVPSSWEPATLQEYDDLFCHSRFIKTFGTHIIVGAKMGGKDVLYVKQHHSSIVRQVDGHTELKKMADEKFTENNGQNRIDSEQVQLNNKGISILYKRRGGREEMNLSQTEWLDTVEVQPDVVSMSFIPIANLLSGVPGDGLLAHAINHYLQFDVGMRPVTGLWLYLEGKRNNRLAVYMHHLSSLPKCFQLVDVTDHTFSIESYDKRYFEKVGWMNFSRVCTAPVEPCNDHSMVTRAQLLPEKSGSKTVLFLRLHFCTVLGNIIQSQSKWDETSSFAHQLGAVSAFISCRSRKKRVLQPSSHILSALYSGGPRVPNFTPKLLKFVDTAEKKRGPEDPPGYWVVSGARLVVVKAKIALRLKYSLLTAMLPYVNTSGA